MRGSLTVPTIYVRNLRKRRSAANTENEAHEQRHVRLLDAEEFTRLHLRQVAPIEDQFGPKVFTYVLGMNG